MLGILGLVAAAYVAYKKRKSITSPCVQTSQASGENAQNNSLEATNRFQNLQQSSPTAPSTDAAGPGYSNTAFSNADDTPLPPPYTESTIAAKSDFGFHPEPPPAYGHVGMV